MIQYSGADHDDHPRPSRYLSGLALIVFWLSAGKACSTGPWLYIVALNNASPSAGSSGNKSQRNLKPIQI